MMRLFIAEKPSVANAIATEIGIKNKNNGYFECHNDNIVTWCFGHMLELVGPDEYTASDIPVNENNGKKRWRLEDLPIIPSEWKIQPKETAKQQLSVIETLIKKSDQIINAGDPDREGQLLVDEILEYYDYTGNVLRFWVSAQDSVSIRRGLDELKKNSEYAGMSAAAKGRSRADWLIGMNLTRAYTLKASSQGSNVLLTVGRVQTPTLALVVERDRTIEKFQSKPFYQIKAVINHPNGAFMTDWHAKDDQLGLDSENRLIDKTVADKLIEMINGKSGIISQYKQDPKKRFHPLAFSLAEITLRASNKFGYTAEQTLNACQALYETHKLTSYPRTDCSYLPESQFNDAESVLKSLKIVNPNLSVIIDGAYVSIRSKTWDDKKVTAHHGIIPTQHQGSRDKLSSTEKNVYDLIVLNYISQFYPVHEYLSTSVDVSIENEILKANGRTVIKNGWMDVFNDSNEDETEKEVEQNIPEMAINDEIKCHHAKRKDCKTSPPKRFTEGTLIRSMENIHQFVTQIEHRKILKEGDGIGTSATRATILAELKKKGYLTTKGKQLISTEVGRSLVDALPEMVKSPLLTAVFERMLHDVDKDHNHLSTFIKTQEQFVRDQITQAINSTVNIAGIPRAEISKTYKCPECKKGLVRRSGKNGNFWACSGYPECKQTFRDVKGRPIIGASDTKQKLAKAV